MRHLLALGLCALSLAASAQTYRWTDSSGRTVISDNPPPSQSRNQSKDSAKALPNDGLSFATRLARDKFPVMLYTAPDCGAPCQQGRDLLTGRGVPFSEKSLQKDEDLAELKQLVGDAYVPSIKVGRQSARGYEANNWNSLLDTAGYPQSAGGKR